SITHTSTWSSSGRNPK
ncbi:hypothetical protein D018_0550B, partial [Vibrio parahaemolyticus VP2007-007]